MRKQSHYTSGAECLQALRVPGVEGLAGSAGLAACRTLPALTTTLSPTRRAVCRRLRRLHNYTGRSRDNRRDDRSRSRIRIATTLARQTSDRVPEIPGLSRSKLDATGASRITDMAVAGSNPNHWRARALIHGLDVSLLAGRRLRSVLVLAAVGLEPLVTQLTTHCNREDVICRAMNAHVRDRRVSSVATREKSTRDD